MNEPPYGRFFASVIRTWSFITKLKKGLLNIMGQSDVGRMQPVMDAAFWPKAAGDKRPVLAQSV